MSGLSRGFLLSSSTPTGFVVPPLGGQFQHQERPLTVAPEIAQESDGHAGHQSTPALAAVSAVAALAVYAATARRPAAATFIGAGPPRKAHTVSCKALPTPSASAGGVATLEAAPATDELPAPPPPPPPPPFNPATQVGVTAPLGYFDPLGFCKVGDYEGFHKLRSAELKHGRVAMMAAAGTAFAHYVKFPGFDKVPAGLGVFGDPAIIVAFFTLFPLAGFIEIIYWKDDLSKEPGNFGDPAGWAGTGLGGAGSYSDDMRNKELNNGRMAMFSILGIFLAELATGKDGIQQFGLP